MSTLINKIKENKIIKVILCLLIIIMFMPLLEILIKVIFSYGTLIGTFSRYIIEWMVCLG